MRTRAAAMCIFFLVMVLTSCGKGKTKTSAEQHEQKEKEIQQKVIAVAATHNAIADWKAALPDKSLTGAYSIQVENALGRSDKRPVAVRAYLEDIVRRDGRLFLEFSDWDELYLTLEATPETVQQVLKENPSNFFAEYVVIAEVQSVQRPTFQIAAENSADGAEVQLQSPDRFHAIGRCVALLNLEATPRM